MCTLIRLTEPDPHQGEVWVWLRETTLRSRVLLDILKFKKLPTVIIFKSKACYAIVKFYSTLL